MAKDTIKEHFQILSIRNWADKTNIAYRKIYDTIALKKPVYNSLTDNEKTDLANALFNDVSKVFKELGMEISIKRKG